MAAFGVTRLAVVARDGVGVVAVFEMSEIWCPHERSRRATAADGRVSRRLESSARSFLRGDAVARRLGRWEGLPSHSMWL